MNNVMRISRPKLSRRVRWLLAINLAIVAALVGYMYLAQPLFVVGGGRSDGWWAARVKASVYQNLPAGEEKGFERLSSDYHTGGWLTTFEEYPQTPEAYQRLQPTGPTATRRVITLQPIGPFIVREQRLLELLREYSSIFFQLPARIEKPLPLALASQWKRETAGHTQYNAGPILSRVLRPRLPDDAAVYLGITMSDLWSGNLGYVFGVGDTRSRTGVYSLVRYFPDFWNKSSTPDDDTLILRRACQVLNHETGHIFGISHCVFFRCSMNGANSLLEADAAPLHYCPVDHRKLQQHIGFDGVKRYRELRTWYARNGLKDEANWLGARTANWQTLQEK